MDAFAALADPTRRRIVELLGRRDRLPGEIVLEFEISGAAISQHLKVLREAGLVQVRAEAQRRVYTLDPSGLQEIDAWLASVRQFWGRRFDALERELRKSTRRKR